MLELDVLFERFLQSGYDALNHQEQILFQALLEEADPTLYNWLLGHEAPDAQFVDLVCKVRGEQL